MNTALADPKARGRLDQIGVEPMPMNAATFAEHVIDETEKWAKVIKAQGISVN